MSFFVSNYSFNNFDLEKIAFFYDKVRIAKIGSEVYSERESPDSPGGFGLERTGKIDFRFI